MFYTYCHIRKDTGKIFYIGKGSKERYKDTHHRNPWWTNIYKKVGADFIILAHWKTEEEAFLHEKFLISCLPNLVNLTLGGDGASGYRHSVEQRIRRSISLKEWHRKNPSASKEWASKRRSNTVSDQHRERLRLLRTGQRLSDETRRKISVALLNRRKQEGFGETISKSMTGRWQCPVFIAKQKDGVIRARGRPVIETTTNQRFETVTAAVSWLVGRGFPKASTSSLSHCIKNSKKVYGTFYFIYESQECQESNTSHILPEH